MSNKKNGNDFETMLCEELARYGYWVHNFANRSYGQPVDVIALKGNQHFLIECKVVSSTHFAKSRFEDNQLLTSERYFETTNRKVWVCFCIKNEIIFMTMDKVLDYPGENIPIDYLISKGYKLTDWVM